MTRTLGISSALLAITVLLCNCDEPRVKEWGVPESRADLPAIAGSYYMGDGLGVNIDIGLAVDGSYRTTWYGCLGLYGESAGCWSITDSLLILRPVFKRGALSDFDDSLVILRSRSNLALLPTGPKYQFFYQKFGLEKSSCLEKDTSRAFIPQSALADLNCDGLSDLVVGANSDTDFTLRLYLGPLLDTSVAAELTFRDHSEGCRACLCGDYGVFEKAVLTDLDSLLDTIPAGYRADANCAQIVVYTPGGECDRLHCYWNHATNKLDWWSL